MLSIENIKKRYRGNPDYSLKGCSFCFEDTGFYLIVGPSASGKTTLLGILSGVDQSYEGKVFYDGVKIDSSNVSSYRSDVSAIVFQDINLIDSLNVEENLRVAFDLCGKKYSRQECLEVLKRVNLPDDSEDAVGFLKKRPSQLSGGQKQRLAIARAIIKGSKIIFLDEPTSSLDEDNAKEIVKILKELSKSCLVVAVTHTPEWFDSDSVKKLELKKGVLKSDSGFEEKSLNPSYVSKRNFSSLSSSVSMKLGLKSLFLSPGKLLISFLITIVSLTSFLSFLSAKYINSNEVAIRNQLQMNNKLCIVQNVEELSDKNKTSDFDRKFLPEQIELLKAYDAHEIFQTHFTFSYYIDEKYSSTFSPIPLLRFMNGSEFSNYFMELWNPDDECFAVDSRIQGMSGVKFPTELDEIAISSLYADIFLRYGSKTNGLKINDVRDLIGKENNGFKIVNIYKTADDSFLNPIRDDNASSSDDEISDLISSSSYSQLFYVAPGYLEHYKSLKRDNPGDGELENDISMQSDARSESSSDYDRYYAFKIKDRQDAMEKLNALRVKGKDRIYSASVKNYFSRQIFFVTAMQSQLADAIFYLLIVFLLLSLFALLLVFTSNYKKQINTYGILKSLGCSNVGILKMIAFEILFLSVGLFLFEACAYALVLAIANRIMKFTMFTIRMNLILLLLCLIAGIGVLIGLIYYFKASKTNTALLLKDR